MKYSHIKLHSYEITIRIKLHMKLHTYGIHRWTSVFHWISFVEINRSFLLQIIITRNSDQKWVFIRFGPN